MSHSGFGVAVRQRAVIQRAAVKIVKISFGNRHAVLIGKRNKFARGNVCRDERVVAAVNHIRVGEYGSAAKRDYACQKSQQRVFDFFHISFPLFLIFLSKTLRRTRQRHR